MTDVFVSYTAVDRALALPIVERLQRQKWSVFWDRNTSPGKKWQDVLEEHLKRAKCVVVLLTRESLKSSWVTFEASIARQRRIIVPLLLDSNLNPQKDLPDMYRDLHVVTLPKEADIANANPAIDLWLKTINDTVRRSALDRLLLVGATTFAATFMSMALIYIALTEHNAVTMWQAGITYLERGSFSKEENERLKFAVRNASAIDLLAPNAASITAVIRDDLPVFFKKPGASMRVLFADPNSEFYDAMMTMTTKGIERSQKARDSDKGLSARSKEIFLTFANQAVEKLQFRQFNTEFRAPMILIDRRLCFVALRLTPDQVTESLRIELADDSGGSGITHVLSTWLRSLAFFLRPSAQDEDQVESCKRHFDAVWERAKPFE